MIIIQIIRLCFIIVILINDIKQIVGYVVLSNPYTTLQCFFMTTRIVFNKLECGAHAERV